MRDSVLSVTDECRITQWRRARSNTRANVAVRQQGAWWTDSPHIKVRPLSRSHKETCQYDLFPYGATTSATESNDVADLAAGHVEET